ncbi:MAG: MotA/TolQ/ExbB proton channel family protein [Acidobacteriota bacterium]
MEIERQVLEIMVQGGWVMWVLFVFSIVGMAVAAERGYFLRKSRTEMRPFLSQLHRALLQRRSVSEALKITEATPGPVARVAATGLRRFSRSTEQLEKALERRSLKELRRLHRGLGILSTTATTAPLLGFLGTVTGIMASFGAMSEWHTSNPALVAKGIQEALTTTAAGLIVAVPAQLLYNTLASRVERITSDVEEVANFLLEAREELGRVD